MQFAKLLLFLILLVFIEIVFVPFPFAFIALFLWAQFRSEEEALILALISGMLLDLFLLRPMGVTSLLFLILLWFTMLYKRKYRRYNRIFIAVFAFLSLLVIEYFYQSSFFLLRAGGGAVLVLLLAKMHFKMEDMYEAW